MKEMEGEALSYERGEEETTHSVCTRQLMDDANRLKCRKNQQKKERKYLFMIGRVMKEVGDSGSSDRYGNALLYLHIRENFL